MTSGPRKVKFGYDLAEDGIHLVPNEAEQEIIALIQQLLAHGFCLREIAAEMTNQGIPIEWARVIETPI